MDEQADTWRVDASTTVDLPARERLQPRRSSLWLLVRTGSVSVGTGTATRRLGPGDAAYLHHAHLHPAIALEDSSVSLADLRYLGPEPPLGPLVARDFAAQQNGVIALLDLCPMRTETAVRRPRMTAAYGELIGSAMRSADEGVADPVVHAAARVMSREPCLPWTLPQLAEVAHVGTTVLVDRFRRATGLTPMQYLRRLRIEQAMVDLDGTDAPLGRIARSAGYGSVEAFVRAFRAHTGCTPGRWRQSSRGRTLIEANASAASVAATAPRTIAAG